MCSAFTMDAMTSLSLRDRFVGPGGRARLLEVLARQRVVAGDMALAGRFAEKLEVCELKPGDTVIDQDGPDTDLFFLLAGRVRVVVNGRFIAIREAGQLLGEMAMLEPSAARSAKVVAECPTVVGRIKDAEFLQAAIEYPLVWKRLAVELSCRLRERSQFHRPPNPQPIVFLGSSREALPVAESIRDGLAAPTVVLNIWSERVFGASRFPIEDLEAQLQSADFAVLVAAADDHVVSRGKGLIAPRDNVIFEVGLFMGALTRTRVFLATPEGVDLKIPTDLLGLTLLRYDPARPSTIKQLCEELGRTITKLGPR
jgi:CRP/FNR family transcriptional regulator, cyclic AMP receptor protein